MTEILFCLDTEDFTSDYSSDAIRDTALLLESEAIKGCYMIVGLLAQRLVASRRFDVIDALKKHDIGFHTYGHTLHPNICEYTDVADYKLAERRLLASECEGLGMVKAAFDRDSVSAAVPPGPSACYAAMYLYSDLKIPVYADSPLHTSDGADIYFCNALHMQYNTALESLFYSGGDFDAKAITGELAKKKRVLLYNHPNIILYKEFWDSVNYKKININPFGRWEEPPRRDAFQTALFYRRMRELIRTLKNDGRFVFRTPGEITREKAVLPPRVVTRDMLPRIRESLRREFCDITEPVNLSLSDIFAAVTAFLRGDGSYTAAEAYGFLKAPAGATRHIEISSEALIKAARRINTRSFLPHKIKIGDINIGPADYIFAALDYLCGGGDMLEILPKTQDYPLERFSNLKNFSLRGQWMYSDDLKDEFLSDRLRLQAWTIHR